MISINEAYYVQYAITEFTLLPSKESRGRFMETIKCDVETGDNLIRDIRSITITYQGYDKTFPMPD